MPELPEVETVRRGLTQLIVGQKIVGLEVLYDKIINNDLADFKDQVLNQTITEIGRRGKYLLIRLSNGQTIVSHLRMEGKYFVKAPDEPVDKHTHVLFLLSNGQQLRYNDVRKFGRMELVPTAKEAEFKSLQKLGVEPTEADFEVNEFYQALQKKKKPIKNALLDQSIVVGLGNIYVDEVLWLSQIHPETLANHLTFTEAQTLRKHIIGTLAKAVKAGGTTIRTYANAFQSSGSFQFSLHVYGRTGELCERCQTPLIKIKLAGRGTHLCPKCQSKR